LIIKQLALAALKLWAVNTEHPNFHQEVTVPLQGSETHAGEDARFLQAALKHT
jgi:hypothetical protein